MSVTKFSWKQQNHSDIITFTSCLPSSFQNYLSSFTISSRKNTNKPHTHRGKKKERKRKDAFLAMITLSKDDWGEVMFNTPSPAGFNSALLTTGIKIQHGRLVKPGCSPLSLPLWNICFYFQWAKQHLSFQESCLLQNNHNFLNIKWKYSKELLRAEWNLLLEVSLSGMHLPVSGPDWGDGKELITEGQLQWVRCTAPIDSLNGGKMCKSCGL